VPRQVVERLREEVAADVRARRVAQPSQEKRRWPWQRG
jgi:hypothetical protein